MEAVSTLVSLLKHPLTKTYLPESFLYLIFQCSNRPVYFLLEPPIKEAFCFGTFSFLDWAWPLLTFKESNLKVALGQKTKRTYPTLNFKGHQLEGYSESKWIHRSYRVQLFRSTAFFVVVISFMELTWQIDNKKRGLRLFRWILWWN